MPYNRCGRYHLGRCCVNGERRDGSIGPTCENCGKALTSDERLEINASFIKVRAIIADALSSLRSK